MIPIDQIKSSLFECKNKDQTKIILLSTGSYCPIHRMHIDIFDIAKNYLEEHYETCIVGGYISPSHDSYVGPKMQEAEFNSIDSKDRIAMTKLAIKESKSDWIAVSSWEAKQTRFVNFPEVLQYHQKYINHYFPKDNIKIYYLCGLDHVLKCNSTSRNIPVIGITRKGTRIPKKLGKVIVVPVDLDKYSDFSSTEIRKRILLGLDYSMLTYDSVIKYIEDHGIKMIRN